MPKLPWIEFPLCALAVLGPLVIVIARLFVKQKTTDKDGSIKEAPRGIGSRMIQLISLLLIVPIVTLLALEGSVTAELTGTLLGSIIGYTLGSVRLGLPREQHHPEWFEKCIAIDEAFDYSRFGFLALAHATESERKQSPRGTFYIYDGVHRTLVLAKRLLSRETNFQLLTALLIVPRPT